MTNEEKYRELFKGNKAKKALNNALDIRKFEIGLYWQRGAYFWALIAAAFAGYFAILSSEHLEDKEYLAFVVGCIGALFTWAWFLVNRGSKYWQENWENHVDMLEDEVTGPLYKTILHRSPPENFIEYISGPAPISVSKINQWVSSFTLCIWIALVWHALPPFKLSAQISVRHILIIVVTVGFGFLMLSRGKTHKKHPPRVMEQREAHIK
jgi:hypothetical protein